MVKKKKKNKKWYEIKYFECDCFSPEHLLRFFKDNEHDNVHPFIMEISLTDYDNIFKRAFKAIKYIFGGEVRYNNVFILHRGEVKEFKDYLVKNCKHKCKYKMLDKFMIADNEEHILEFEVDEDGMFLEANIIFSKKNFWGRIKKARQHIGGMRCKHGVWDDWDLNDENMSKLIYLADKIIKANKDSKNK